MTAKILSWGTFGLLLAGSLPFVSNSEVSASANYAIPPAPGSIPACGACNTSPPQEFQKLYAIDRNALCAPETPYRVSARLATKIICENGSYWICEDTSSSACNTYISRPECPQDTCAK
ncbi:MAG TPA: hypothetical protein VK934_07265 [Fimbriimonas sp.]|nr:hypothetical protein [Fimbriimonas sp.]